MLKVLTSIKPVVGAVCATLLLASCASIVSKSSYLVTIDSTPNGSNFVVTDVNGNAVHSGITPQSVMLPAGRGYFERAEYTVTYEKQGFGKHTAVIRAGIDGWYWGNILFGGLIGLLIVDPATGAMYTLPDRVAAVLPENNAATSNSLPALKIISIDEVNVADRLLLMPLPVTAD